MNLSDFTGIRNKHYTQYLVHFYSFYLQQVFISSGLRDFTLFMIKISARWYAVLRGETDLDHDLKKKNHRKLYKMDI